MDAQRSTLEDVRKIAKQKMKGICGVFGVCNGDPSRICQGNSYGKVLRFGGIGSGYSFWNNYRDLQAVELKMQVISSQFIPETTWTWCGEHLAMPIMAASVSGVNSFGGEDVISEADFCQAVVNGCKQAGTVGWRGDTYTYSADRCFGLEAIQKAQGWGVKIIKPRSQTEILAYIERAEAIGAMAVGVDVDGCYSHAMTRFKKDVFHKSQHELEELIEATKLPFIVKGVMTVEDALSAKNAGAHTIVVSNHGGRVLDATPGTAKVLPQIADAIQGEITVLVDGGIRTGYDVLKMLALGADGVLVGRDVVRAAVGGGSLGVQLQMAYLQKTLEKAMSLVGVGSLVDISSKILIGTGKQL